MIKDNELKIAKVSSWEDTYENFFFKSDFRSLKDGREYPASENILNSFWGQCWTTEKDSDALWRKYSSDEPRVRIKTTVQKLMDVVCASGERDMCLSYLGFVEYKKKDELRTWLEEKQPINSPLDFQQIGKESLFMKRDLFEYENEFRVIFNGDNSDSELKAYKIDVADFIDEIVFDPRITADHYEKRRAKLISQSVWSNKIRKSAYCIQGSFSSIKCDDFEPVNVQINF
jgi:hypothetical protein